MSEPRTPLDEVMEKINAIQQEARLVEDTKRLIDTKEESSNEVSNRFTVIDESLFDQIKTGKTAASAEAKPVKEKNQKEKSAIRRLLDEEEDENDEEDVIQEPSALYDDVIEDIADFDSEEDRDEIYRDLKGIVGKMAIKQFALLLLSFCSIYFFIGMIKPSLIGGNPSATWVRLVLLLIDLMCVGLSFGIFGQGLKALLHAKADTDTLLALLAGSLVLVRVVSVVRPGALPFDFCLEPFLAIGLLFNVAGKKRIASNIKHNFKAISTSEDKLTVTVPASCENNNALILETGEGGEVMYAHKTRLVSKFIEHSYSDFAVDHKLDHFMFAVVILIAVFTILILQLIGGRVALMFPAVALSVTIPFFSRFYYGASVYGVGKKIRKRGGVLTSASSAKQLEDSDLLVISEEDFIGKDAVLLQGVRAMGEMQIDDLITNVAALFNHVGTPLKPLFAKMIDTNTVSLPRVDDIYYHEGMGYTCLIHSKMFLVGNRELMQSFNIPFPESLFNLELKDGHFPVYVAYHRSPAGMFLTSYEKNEMTDAAIRLAAEEYLGIGIVSNNFLFNKRLLKQLYPHMNDELIHLISSKTSTSSRPMLELKEKSADLMASLSGPKGLAACLLGGSKLLLALKINLIIKILYVLTSVSLIFFIALSGYSANTAVQMMLFQLIWMLPMGLVCSFCK